MSRDLKTPLSKTTEPSFRTAFSSAKKSGKKHLIGRVKITLLRLLKIKQRICH